MTPITSIKILPDDPWWSGLPQRPDGRQFRLSEAERRMMRRRRPISVSAWAEKYRVITMGHFQGIWRNALTPYLVGIMDAIQFRSIRTVIVCASPQIGKTEAANNFIAWAIDHAPGPVLYVYPDAITAKENSKDRILPMIEASPRLKRYLTGWEDDKTNLRIKLIHMPIYLAWAGSAARLANKPIRYVVFDETDKYPTVSNLREADPISLGEKRTITYRYDHKIIKLSTPTVEQAPIWQALQTEAEEVFQYEVPCLVCGQMQVMDFERIRWPKDRDADGKEVHPSPERVEKEALARYVCIHCGAEWADYDRDRAVGHGVWTGRRTGLAVETYLVRYQPRKIGFHLPAWVSRFVSLSSAAAAFIRARHAHTSLRDFRNAYQAIPWLDYTQERQEDAILALRDDRPRGLVPTGVIGLTAAVDTQDHGFWYEIRAWGEDFESWQIREGYVPSDHHGDFSALDKVLFEDAYYDAEHTPYPVQLVFIDSGGHRTWEVYQWCRSKGRGVIPIKGEGRMTGTHAWSRQDTIPGTNRPIPGGIQILRLNVNLYKDQLAGRLQIAPADPGAWHLHSETTLAWATQMCAESVNDKGIWECPPGKENHAWDCSAYNWAAADLFVRHWRRPKPTDRRHEEDSDRREHRTFLPRYERWTLARK